MNFFTPERGPQESFEHYKARQKQQKYYMKRGCLMHQSVRMKNNKLFSYTYVKEREQ